MSVNLGCLDPYREKRRRKLSREMCFFRDEFREELREKIAKLKVKACYTPLAVVT